MGVLGVAASDKSEAIRVSSCGAFGACSERPDYAAQPASCVLLDELEAD
jgi:hypothetical protein